MRSTVLARVDLLDDAVAALVERRLDLQFRAEAEQAAHKLAGSAGTFGFLEASRLARRLERRFAASEVEGDDVWRAAAEAVALRTALEEPAQTRTPRPDVDRTPVLMLSDDPGLIARLQTAGSRRALEVVAAEQVRQARDLVALHAPAAVVVDSRLGRFDGEGASDSVTAPYKHSGAALAALRSLALPEDRPAVLLTDLEAQPDRVAAARAGVNAYVSRRWDAVAIADAVVEQLQAGAVERILACDDDEAVLEMVKAVLESERVLVDTLSDPRAFWETLQSEPPDVVLLDIDMPHVNGLELCRTLRSDPTYTAVPVIFLTSHADRASVQAAFDAGADDVVAKPVVADELRSRVTNRLDRARLLRRLADTDPLTSLPNRRAAMPRMERLLALAAHHEQPLSVAVLDLDRFKQVNDQQGHAAGDAVLRELGRLVRTALRGGEVAARWGGDEFVLALYGMGRHDGLQRLAEVLEDLRAVGFRGQSGTFDVSFSGGLAQHPVDGADLATLHDAARRALRDARHAGGDRLRAVDQGGGDRGSCDVAVIEDDPAVADLLQHALRTRGYTAVVLDDGGEARRRLIGPNADVQARVVVLDVDLPGLNGLDLLAELRRHGALERIRVVMLTGRSGEQEILQALQLGAVDHVAKPFSVPVLVERIRRALSS